MPSLYTSIYATTALQLLPFASSSSNGINLVYSTFSLLLLSLNEDDATVIILVRILVRILWRYF
jgi:hypothetical protein